MSSSISVEREGSESTTVRHAHPVYRYPVRAVRVVRLRIGPQERETGTDTPKPSLPSASKEPIVP